MARSRKATRRDRRKSSRKSPRRDVRKSPRSDSRKGPRGEPRNDEHIRKRVEKRAKGPDRRTQYDIYVTVNFELLCKLDSKASPMIRPVNKWDSDTAIRIQGRCPGGKGTGFGFHTICEDNNRNHLDERVHLLIKCPDCPNCHCFLKIKGWVDGETSIPMNCRTKIGQIECCGFEPIGGVGMLQFIDEFSVHSTLGESVGLRIPLLLLGKELEVGVNGLHGQIALGRIIGIDVDYMQQSC